jgi:hypothetical protein
MSTDKVDEKIQRPPKVSTTSADGIAHQLHRIREWQRGQGYGSELDASRKAPEETNKPDNNVIRRPVEPSPPNEAVATATTGTTAAAVPPGGPTAANNQRSMEDLMVDYQKAMRLHLDDQGRYDRALQAHYASLERITKYKKQHDMSVAQFGTFFEEYRFKKVLEHPDYIKEPTLYMAYDVVSKLFLNVDNSGMKINL